jgi:uncharacterized membrane protein
VFAGAGLRCCSRCRGKALGVMLQYVVTVHPD